MYAHAFCLSLLIKLVPELYPSLSYPALASWIGICACLPIIWAGILLFLSFKNPKLPHPQTPILLRQINWIRGMTWIVIGLLGFIPLLELKPLHSIDIESIFKNQKITATVARVAYWFGNPTFFSVASIVEETSILIKVGDQIQDPNPSNPMPTFLELEKSHRFTTPGIILMTASVVMYRMKEKSNSIKTSSEQKTPSMKKILLAQVSLGMLEDFNTLLDIKKRSVPFPSMLNPIAFLLPSAPIEVALLTGINMFIDSHFQESFTKQISKTIQTTESNIDQISDPTTKNDMQARLIQIKNRFSFNTKGI